MEKIRFTGMFLYITAVSGLVFILSVLDISQIVRSVSSGLVLASALVLWYFVRTRLVDSVEKLAAGASADKDDKNARSEMPVNDRGPVGAAARALWELTLKEERVQGDLDEALNRLEACEAREKELDQALSALNEEISGFAADLNKSGIGNGEFNVNLSESKYSGKLGDAARVINSLASSLKSFSLYAEKTLDEMTANPASSALDIEQGGAFGGVTGRIKTLSEALIRLTAQAGGTFDAIVSGDFKSSFDQKKYPLLAAKADNLCLYVKKLAAERDSALNGLERKAEEITGLAFRLQTAAAGGDDLRDINRKARDMAAQTASCSGLLVEAENTLEKAQQLYGDSLNMFAAMQSTMSEINASSGKIMNIIKSIDDISFQTQLLSLNASIEAAHAGQFGKSFAVVASKVSELAGRSKESANETGTLLENMLEQFRESLSLSEKTSSIMAKFSNSLNEAVAAVKETGKGIQAQSETVNDLQSVSGMFIGNMDESSNAAKELLEAAEELGEGPKNPVIQPPVAVKPPVPEPKFTVAAVKSPEPAAKIPEPKTETKTETKTGIKPLGEKSDPPKPRPSLKAAVVSNVQTNGFDGSKEYNKRDFGKY